MDSFSVRAVLGKLHHDLPSIYHSPVKPIDCLLRLVLILVPHERKPSRITSPAVPRDVDVDDLAVLLEERGEVIRRSAEGDVEDEEGVGVADRRRAGATEARHVSPERSAAGGAVAGTRRGGWRR